MNSERRCSKLPAILLGVSAMVVVVGLTSFFAGFGVRFRNSATNVMTILGALCVAILLAAFGRFDNRPMIVALRTVSLLPFCVVLVLFSIYCGGWIRNIVDGSYRPRLEVIAEHVHRNRRYVIYCDTGAMAFSSVHLRIRRVVRVVGIEFYEDVLTVPKCWSARLREDPEGNLILERSDGSIITVVR